MIQRKPVRSPRRILRLAAGVAMAVACGATASAQHAPLLKIVSDPACPLVVESATLNAAAEGVSITYSIRNGEKETVKELVITAAAANLLGEVVSLEMLPVVKKIAGRSSQQFTIVFRDLELENADFVSVGVQGVRWSGRRAEWRTALRVSGPTVLAAKN